MYQETLERNIQLQNDIETLENIISSVEEDLGEVRGEGNGERKKR
jgi:hypothetical protein